MSEKEYLINAITEQLKECEDLELLHFILGLLISND